MQEDKIAYEPHPVSPERKAELRAQGYRIIDAAFKPAEAEPEALAEEAEPAPAPRGRRARAEG
jgi:hypothetical protein